MRNLAGLVWNYLLILSLGLLNRVINCALCNYYPSYPSTDTYSTINCPSYCCLTAYPKSANSACCNYVDTNVNIPSFISVKISSESTNEFKWWWVYAPAAALCLLSTIIIIVVSCYCCHKRDKLNKARVMNSGYVPAYPNQAFVNEDIPLNHMKLNGAQARSDLAPTIQIFYGNRPVSKTVNPMYGLTPIEVSPPGYNDYTLTADTKNHSESPNPVKSKY